MNTFVYPTNTSLMMVDRLQFPDLQLSDPIFQHFPITPLDSERVEWEQQDYYLGLTQIRGINGDPPRVTRVGAKRYSMEPGVYGEYSQIDEREITRRRPFGQYVGAIDVSDIVLDLKNQQRHRQVQRITKQLWDLVIYGYFSVAHSDGAVVHTDAYKQRLFTSSVTWDTVATATPLSDFRAVQLLGRGFGASFGTGAVAYMNQQTANWMLANTNAADLYGRRSAGLSTLNTMTLVNQLLMGDGLPEVRINDLGYYDDAGAYQLRIPDGYVAVIGKRDQGNPKIGSFFMTRNANTTPIGAPQPYVEVIESLKPPKTIEVHTGFNGGPAIFHPGAIVVMKVK